MTWLLGAWGWVRSRATWILGGLSLVLAGLLLWSRHRARVGSLKDAVAVEAAGRKVAALDARREALAEREDDVSAELAQVEAERAKVLREAVSRAEDVEGMSDTEVVEAWRDLYRGSR